MLEIKPFSEWSLSTPAAEPSAQIKGYADYLRTSYFKNGQLDDETESMIQSGAYQKAVENDLISDDEPDDVKQSKLNELIAPVAKKDSDAKFLLDHYQIDYGTDTPEYTEKAAVLRKYLAGKASGAPVTELESVVDNIVSDRTAVNNARKAAVDRGDFSVAFIDEEGGRQPYTGPNTRKDIITSELDTLLQSGAVDSSDLRSINELTAPINGGLSTFADASRSLWLQRTFDSVASKDAKLQSAIQNDVNTANEQIRAGQRTGGEAMFEGVKKTVAAPFAFAADVVGDVMGITTDEERETLPAITQLLGNEALRGKFTEDEIQRAYSDYVATRAGAIYDPDKPQTGFRTDSLGNPIIAAPLLANKAEFERALNVAPLNEEQKTNARASREKLLEQQSTKMINLIVGEDSDAVGALANARAQGKSDRQFIEDYVGSGKYSGGSERFQQLAQSTWSSIATVPVGIAAMLGFEPAAKQLGEFDKEQSDREEYSRLFGDEFGLGFQILNTIPQVAVDIGLTMGTAAGYAAAKTAITGGIKSTMRAGLRGAATDLIDETAAAAVRAASAAGGEALTGQAIRDAGSSFAARLTAGLERAEQLIPVAATSFTRSAGSTYGSIYNQLPDTMTHEEKHRASLGYAIAAGMSTAVITSGMSFLGAGAVEDLATGTLRPFAGAADDAAAAAGTARKIGLGSLNYKQAKLLFEQTRNQGARVTDQVFQKAVRAGVGNAYKNFLITSTKGALSEGVEEALDTAIQMKLEDAALDRNTPMSEKINQIFHAFVIGGALGGGTESVTQMIQPLDATERTTALQARSQVLNNIATELRKTNSNATAALVQSKLDEAQAQIDSERAAQAAALERKQKGIPDSVDADPNETAIDVDNRTYADVMFDTVRVGNFEGNIEPHPENPDEVVLVFNKKNRPSFSGEFMTLGKISDRTPTTLAVKFRGIGVLEEEKAGFPVGTRFVTRNKTEFAMPTVEEVQANRDLVRVERDKKGAVSQIQIMGKPISEDLAASSMPIIVDVKVYPTQAKAFAALYNLDIGDVKDEQAVTLYADLIGKPVFYERQRGVLLQDEDGLFVKLDNKIKGSTIDRVNLRGESKFSRATKVSSAAPSVLKTGTAKNNIPAGTPYVLEGGLNLAIVDTPTISWSFNIDDPAETMKAVGLRVVGVNMDDGQTQYPFVISDDRVVALAKHFGIDMDIKPSSYIARRLREIYVDNRVETMQPDDPALDLQRRIDARLGLQQGETTETVEPLGSDDDYRRQFVRRFKQNLKTTLESIDADIETLNETLAEAKKEKGKLSSSKKELISKDRKILQSLRKAKASTTSTDARGEYEWRIRQITGRLNENDPTFSIQNQLEELQQFRSTVEGIKPPDSDSLLIELGTVLDVVNAVNQTQSEAQEKLSFEELVAWAQENEPAQFAAQEEAYIEAYAESAVGLPSPKEDVPTRESTLSSVVGQPMTDNEVYEKTKQTIAGMIARLDGRSQALFEFFDTFSMGVSDYTRNTIASITDRELVYASLLADKFNTIVSDAKKKLGRRNAAAKQMLDKLGGEILSFSSNVEQASQVKLRQIDSAIKEDAEAAYRSVRDNIDSVMYRKSSVVSKTQSNRVKIVSVIDGRHHVLVLGKIGDDVLVNDSNVRNPFDTEEEANAFDADTAVLYEMNDGTLDLIQSKLSYGSYDLASKIAEWWANTSEITDDAIKSLKDTIWQAEPKINERGAELYNTINKWAELFANKQAEIERLETSAAMTPADRRKSRRRSDKAEERGIEIPQPQITTISVGITEDELNAMGVAPSKKTLDIVKGLAKRTGAAFEIETAKKALVELKKVVYTELGNTIKEFNAMIVEETEDETKTRAAMIDQLAKIVDANYKQLAPTKTTARLSQIEFAGLKGAPIAYNKDEFRFSGERELFDMLVENGTSTSDLASLGRHEDIRLDFAAIRNMTIFPAFTQKKYGLFAEGDSYAKPEDYVRDKNDYLLEQVLLKYPQTGYFTRKTDKDGKSRVVFVREEVVGRTKKLVEYETKEVRKRKTVMRTFENQNEFFETVENNLYLPYRTEGGTTMEYIFTNNYEVTASQLSDSANISIERVTPKVIGLIPNATVNKAIVVDGSIVTGFYKPQDLYQETPTLAGAFFGSTSTNTGGAKTTRQKQKEGILDKDIVDGGTIINGLTRSVVRRISLSPEYQVTRNGLYRLLHSASKYNQDIRNSIFAEAAPALDNLVLVKHAQLHIAERLLDSVLKGIEKNKSIKLSSIKDDQKREIEALKRNNNEDILEFAKLSLTEADTAKFFNGTMSEIARTIRLMNPDVAVGAVSDEAVVKQFGLYLINESIAVGGEFSNKLDMRVKNTPIRAEAFTIFNRFAKQVTTAKSNDLLDRGDKLSIDFAGSTAEVEAVVQAGTGTERSVFGEPVLEKDVIKIEDLGYGESNVDSSSLSFESRLLAEHVRRELDSAEDNPEKAKEIRNALKGFVDSIGDPTFTSRNLDTMSLADAAVEVGIRLGSTEYMRWTTPTAFEAKRNLALTRLQNTESAKILADFFRSVNIFTGRAVIYNNYYTSYIGTKLAKAELGLEMSKIRESIDTIDVFSGPLRQQAKEAFEAEIAYDNAKARYASEAKALDFYMGKVAQFGFSLDTPMDREQINAELVKLAEDNVAEIDRGIASIESTLRSLDLNKQKLAKVKQTLVDAQQLAEVLSEQGKGLSPKQYEQIDTIYNNVKSLIGGYNIPKPLSPSSEIGNRLEQYRTYFKQYIETAEKALTGTNMPIALSDKINSRVASYRVALEEIDSTLKGRSASSYQVGSEPKVIKDLLGKLTKLHETSDVNSSILAQYVSILGKHYAAHETSANDIRLELQLKELRAHRVRRERRLNDVKSGEIDLPVLIDSTITNLQKLQTIRDRAEENLNKYRSLIKTGMSQPRDITKEYEEMISMVKQHPAVLLARVKAGEKVTEKQQEIVDKYVRAGAIRTREAKIANALAKLEAKKAQKRAAENHKRFPRNPFDEQVAKVSVAGPFGPMLVTQAEAESISKVFPQLPSYAGEQLTDIERRQQLVNDIVQAPVGFDFQQSGVIDKLINADADTRAFVVDSVNEYVGGALATLTEREQDILAEGATNPTKTLIAVMTSANRLNSLLTARGYTTREPVLKAKIRKVKADADSFLSQIEEQSAEIDRLKKVGAGGLKGGDRSKSIAENRKQLRDASNRIAELIGLSTGAEVELKSLNSMASKEEIDSSIATVLSKMGEAVRAVDATRNKKVKPARAATKKRALLSVSIIDPRLRGVALRKNTKDAETLGLVDGDPSSMITALSKISKSGTKFQRKLADMLLGSPQLLSGINLHVGEFSGRFAGKYVERTNSIALNLAEHNGRGLADVLLHELIHAATVKVIQNPKTPEQRAAVARLRAIRSLATNMASSMGVRNKVLQLALASDEEFVTYALTTPDVERILRNLRPEGQRSIWQRIIEVVRNIFGKKTELDMNASDAIEDLFSFVNMALGHSETFNNSPTYLDSLTLEQATRVIDQQIANASIRYEAQRRLIESQTADATPEPEPEPEGDGPKARRLIDELVPQSIEVIEESLDGAAMATKYGQPNKLFIDPAELAPLVAKLSDTNARSAVQAAIDEEVAHLAADSVFTLEDYDNIAVELGQEKLEEVANEYYQKIEPDPAKRSAMIKGSMESGDLSPRTLAAEWVRKEIQLMSYGNYTESRLAFLSQNPNLIQRMMNGLRGFIAKLRSQFDLRPTVGTAARISMASREYRRLKSLTNEPQLEMDQVRYDDSEAFLRVLDNQVLEEEEDGVFYSLPVATTGNKSWIDTLWGKIKDKMYMNLGHKLKEMVDQRDGVIAEAQFDMEWFAKKFPKLRDEALAANIPLDKIGVLLGTTDVIVNKKRQARIQAKLNEFRKENAKAPNLDELVRKKDYELHQQEAADFAKEFRLQQEAAERELRAAGFGQLVDTAVEFRQRISRFKVGLGFDETNDVYLKRSYRYFTSAAYREALRKGLVFTDENGDTIDFGKRMLEVGKHLYEAKILKNAKDSGEKLSDAEINSRVLKEMDEYLDGLDKQATQSREQLGINSLTKDINLFKPKKDIDKVLRDLLGEVKDPFENAIRTIYSIARTGANAEFQKQFEKFVIENGLGSRNGSDPNMELLYGSRNDKALGPIAGLYVDKKIAKAMRELFDNRGQIEGGAATSIMQSIGKGMSFASGAAITAKTSLSVGFYPRNILGGMLLSTMQGIPPLTPSFIKSIVTASQAYGTLASKREEDVRNNLRRLIELQIIRDDPNGRIAMDMLRGFVTKSEEQMDDAFREILKAQQTNDYTGVFAKYIGKPVGSVANATAVMNNVIDSFFKINAYGYELAGLQKSYGNEKTLAELEQLAARKVKATFPSHSQQLDITKAFNRSPWALQFIPFLRWKTEVLRVAVNTPMLALEEIRSGNANEMKRGFQRMLGLIGTTAVAGPLLGGLFSTLFRQIADDEDKESDENRSLTDEEIAALREGLPEWQKNHGIYARLVGGKVQIIDLTNILPLSQFTDPASIAFEGLLTGKGINVKALAGYIGEELLGTQIAYSAFSEALRENRDDFGNPIVLESDSALVGFGKILKHVGSQAYLPSVIGKGMDVARTGEKNRAELVLGEITGARPQLHEKAEILRRGLQRIEASNTEAAAARAKLFTGRALDLESEVPELINDYQDAVNRNQARLRNHLLFSEGIGISKQSILAAAKQARVSEKALVEATNGVRQAWTMNKEAFKKMEYNMNQTGEADPIARMNKIMEVLKANPTYYNITNL